MSEQDSTVEITVRCAFQAVCEDIKVSCPRSWTVLQFKEHLRDNTPSKLDVRSQRLIYAGTVLRDEKSIGEILAERNVEGTKFFHLATTTPQQPTIQKRVVPTPSPSSQAAAPTGNDSTSTANIYSNPWSAYYSQYAQHLQPTSMASGDYAQAYSNYYASYMSYYQQQMAGFSTGVQFPQGVNAAIYPVQQGMNVQAAVNAVPAVNGDLQAPAVENAVAGGGGAEVENGAVQVDALERAYRFLRLILLAVVVYSYATIERALLVTAVTLFVLFIQMRRAQAAADEANRRAAAAAIAAERARLRETANNNDGENGGVVDVEDDLEPPAAVQEIRTGMQIFLSTCFTFITTFFTSLVPENPRPLNLN